MKSFLNLFVAVICLSALAPPAHAAVDEKVRLELLATDLSFAMLLGADAARGGNTVARCAVVGQVFGAAQQLNVFLNASSARTQQNHAIIEGLRMDIESLMNLCLSGDKTAEQKLAKLASRLINMNQQLEVVFKELKK